MECKVMRNEFYPNYLVHFGIKGQKWGVRRFETESGHLTAAGKARYDDYEYAKSQTKKAKEAYRQANAKASSTYNTADLKAAKNAQGMYALRKKQQSDAKAKMQMNTRSEAGKKVGKHEQKLIEKYKAKGMSQEEAEVAAFKRVKLEKKLAIAGAVTVAAAAAYGAKKYHDYVADEVLEVGKTKMKRIENNADTSLFDTFYASNNAKDNDKYTGMYGAAHKQAGHDVYQKSLELTENIKIASDKNAKSTMTDVLKKTSSQNRDEIIKSMENRKQYLSDDKQGKAFKKGLEDIKAGRYDTKAAYDAFNIHMGSNHLFGNGGGGDKVMAEYKQALKDKGYSGIKDRNDASYSGYNAKSARIIFDNSKVKVSDVRKVSDSEINKKNEKAVKDILMRNTAKAYGGQAAAIAGLAGLGAAASSASRKSENNKAIAAYKKEHPGTKLSNDEILENYYGGKK